MRDRIKYHLKRMELEHGMKIRKVDLSPFSLIFDY